MTHIHIYENENISKIQKSRAEEFQKHIPSKVELDKVDKVWMLETSVPLSSEKKMYVQVKYFEEATIFNVITLLPPHFNNDIFKRKIDSRSEDFLILDKYPARIYQKEFYGMVCLHLNVAYLYTEGEEDSYDISNVADILIHIGTSVRDELATYLETSFTS